jgi:hypothetical protein
MAPGEGRRSKSGKPVVALADVARMMSDKLATMLAVTKALWIVAMPQY